jgi:serine/threonine-protein kinase
MESKLGRYEIQSEIGRGAMGVVYRALDPVLDRTVAIKTINLSGDAQERAEYEGRFFQEAKAAGGLSHRNIVTIYDVGNSGDVAYMAMEHLEGSELRALYGEGKRAAVDFALDVAAQVADGLAYAHERGVVHRDIKPANIMVLRDGQAKIMDFGIARMRASEVKTQTGMLLGSPRYIAPEVFLGKRADARSDLFSLGIILYEMLTGAAPFAGESMSALMYQTINFTPPPPSAVNRGVPEMLDFIVAKLLSKDPEKRHQSGSELAADLRECLRHPMPERASDTATLPSGAAPAPSLIGSSTRAQLLSGTAPTSRTGDALGDTVEDAAGSAPTLGISRSFDSLAATQKVAARSGIAPADGFAATVKLREGQPARAPWRERGNDPWTRRDAGLFAAGIALACVIAGMLAAG